MHLLFILSSTAQLKAELLNMAQLSAAFGQRVSLLLPASTTVDELDTIKQTGIDTVLSYPSYNDKASYSAIKLLIAQADRIIRL